MLQTRAVGEEQIARFLQREKGIPEDQALILARFAGGNPGQALLLTEDQEFLQMRDQTVELLAHMDSADAVRISEFASDIDPARRGDVLAFVLMWFRDVLLYFSTQNSENLIFQEDIQYIIGAAGMLGYERIGRFSRRSTRRRAACSPMSLRIRSSRSCFSEDPAAIPQESLITASIQIQKFKNRDSIYIL